jgi:DNA-binding CsgD family transcriptional regulator
MEAVATRIDAARRERLTGAESLTPSERRIVEIVTSGGSNAEIGQALS